MTAGGYGYGSMQPTDSDRENTRTILQDAHTQGRLSWAEFDSRSTALASAQTHDQLAGLTADLQNQIPGTQPQGFGDVQGAGFQGDGFQGPASRGPASRATASRGRLQGDGFQGPASGPAIRAAVPRGPGTRGRVTRGRVTRTAGTRLAGTRATSLVPAGSLAQAARASAAGRSGRWPPPMAWPSPR